MKLSIITINRNNASGLKKTLDSVACQTWRDFEHIIVDGASTDASVDVIKEYVHKIEDKGLSIKEKPSKYEVKWLSKPDTGIYNAMNKGIRMASGEYCFFLNSGDVLYENMVLQHVFEMNLWADIFYGNYYTSSGLLRSGCDEDEVTCFTFMDYTIHHTGCAFIKRSLFEKYGYYDETLKIVSDWKWFLIAIGLGNATVEKIEVTLSVYDEEGISSKLVDARMQERERTIKDIVPPLIYRDYKKYYELVDSKFVQERKIRQSWSYRVGDFILKPVKFLAKIFK